MRTMTMRLPPVCLDPAEHEAVLDEMIELGIIRDHGESFTEVEGALAAYCKAHPLEDAAGLREFVGGVVTYRGDDDTPNGGRAIAC